MGIKEVQDLDLDSPIYPQVDSLPKEISDEEKDAIEAEIQRRIAIYRDGFTQDHFWSESDW